MRSRRSSGVSFLLCIILVVQYACLAHTFQIDTISRVFRGRLGTLYDLRSKLGGSTPSPTTTLPITTKSPPNPGSDIALKKESRGYAFHYSSADVSHPIYSASAIGDGVKHQDFQSRVGKVSESSGNKWESADKSWDKYSKLAYKIGTSKPGTEVKLNSFNIYEQSEEFNGTTQPEVRTTSLPIISSTTLTTTAMPSPSINFGPIKALGQGLNSAMTKVLTEKLMNLMDQEVPEGFLKPFRHLVASGNRMVEFWDKRTSARDGKVPGFVELLGYGLDQLKRFRDGQQLKTADMVSDLTPASKTLMQGMITVKKLTNRVLGYDTDDDAIESRGGYGHDGYGGGGGYGHHVSYGGTYGGLDPFSLLAALAFGAFLLQLLLTMMSTSARSLDVSDLNTPLLMSDFHMPNFMSAADKIFGTPTVRTKRQAFDGEESRFSTILDSLDGALKAYQTIKQKPKCTRLYLCRIAVQNAMGDANTLFTQLYTFGLGALSKDKSASRFFESIQKRVMDGEDVNCDHIVKECVPRELKQEEA